MILRMSENGELELTPQFALLLGKMMVNQWTYIGAEVGVWFRYRTSDTPCGYHASCVRIVTRDGEIWASKSLAPQFHGFHVIPVI